MGVGAPNAKIAFVDKIQGFSVLHRLMRVSVQGAPNGDGESLRRRGTKVMRPGIVQRTHAHTLFKNLENLIEFFCLDVKFTL